MEQERRSIRVGLAVIACAVLFRVMGGVTETAAAFFSDPSVASFLIYLETGRVVRLDPVDTVTETVEETVEESWEPVPPTEPKQVSFRAEEAELVDVSYQCDYTPDIGQLLQSPLSWDLTEDGPAVLILHTHATESYTQTPEASYTPSSPYRTEDIQYNMVRIGDEITRVLEAHGIQVIHDTTLHDEPSYNGSYSYARKTIMRHLEENPSLKMVLDIHRDALELADSMQLGTQAVVDGIPSAQLMMVVGTNAGGLHHPAWQDNMALAVKLHVQLERTWPGICRPISFRTERFNQDLSSGALLIEVGAAGDTLEEALVAARALADGIAVLSEGTATTDSTS